MNAWDVCKINILAPVFFLVGCTDASPTVAILRSIQGFDFSESHIVTASLSSVTLQAQCSPFIDAVEMSFDNGATWIQPSSYQASASNGCQNGIFTITLSNTLSPWSTEVFSKGQTVTVKFRALPRLGDWIYRSVDVQYMPSFPTSQEILAGSQVQTGTGYKLRGRIRTQQQAVASGGSYKIHGRIVQ